VRLDEAFLHGRLYLSENLLSFLELAPVGNKYFIIPPPMPAFLILPFVFFAGPNFNQTLASIILGALNAVLIYSLFKKLFPKSESPAIWMTVLFSLGTIHWYLSSVGSVWYFGQITGVFFTFLALNELFGLKRAWLVGLFLGAAFWSRLPVILSATFFIIMLTSFGKKEFFSKKNIFTAFEFILGLSVFIVLDFLYNYMRFGTIFDVSYYLQGGVSQGILQTSVFSKGYFNLAYIPDHLKIFLLKGPVFLSYFPYLQPSWAGMAIWLTTPAFIFAFFSPIKEKITWACWIAIIPIMILVMSHGGTGFSQFGYRYAMDFYPFLLILTAKGMVQKKLKIKWHHIIFILAGVLVNLWGVLWINKFNWVGW
jgi:hypothetical protein